MKHILFIVALMGSLDMAAQTTREQDEPLEAMSYSHVEQNPRPYYNVKKYIARHLIYPNYARGHEIEGTVIIKFLVTATGKITECEIAKGIGGGCDQQALKVIRKMRPWHPGRQNGKPVQVWCTIPVEFKLKGRQK